MKLIYFCSKSCGPCMVNERTIRAAINDGRLTMPVEKIDTDNADALARYEISSVPTTILIDDNDFVKWKKHGIVNTQEISTLEKMCSNGVMNINETELNNE